MKGLKKQDVVNMSYKDVAYLILEKRKKGLNTLDLFNEIAKLFDLSKSVIDQKIGDFYTSLMTDKRFALVDGLWDLREHHKSEKVIHKINDDTDELEEVEEETSDYDSDQEDLEEESFDNENTDDEYQDDDDDLADLVVIDEEEMEEDLN